MICFGTVHLLSLTFVKRIDLHKNCNGVGKKIEGGEKNLDLSNKIFQIPQPY